MRTMSVINHLKLLLWKNYLLQVRHPWVTVIELMVPCLFVAMLAAIRLKVDFTYHSNNTEYERIDIHHIPEFKLASNIISPEWIVMYSPNTTRIEEIMEKVVHKLRRYATYASVKPQAFPSEDEIISFYNSQETYYQNLILCGVIFENETNLDRELKYKLRFPSTPKYAARDPTIPITMWWTEFTFPLFSKPGPRQEGNHTGGVPGYYEEGFLAVQHAVAMTVANHITNSTDNIEKEVEVYLQRFPYPPYIEDIFLLALQFLFPIILMLSFIYPAVNLTKNLVIEKEKRLKESMKMMGLKSWLHWFAWFIKSFTWLAISSGLLSLLLTINIKEGVGILNKSNGLLIYLFFISYAISCIALCFMLSTFFSKANVSAVGSGVIFFIAFMPYFFVFPRYRDLSFNQKLSVCLSCNSGLAMGSMIIAMWEGNSVGIQWSNLSKTASPDDTLTIEHIIIMFFIDTIIYLLITFYVEAVFPGEYGVPLPWYFPFKKSYWFGNTFDIDKSENLELSAYDNPSFQTDQTDKAEIKSNAEYFEKEPTGLKTGVKIIGLSKTFDKRKYVVKDLHLNAYRGQITALLGHNGAGKTTTMSILTGLFPPSTGTAILNGFDIRTDMDSIRSSLGICPQFDVLFDELTVEEHLLFYCELKNFDPTLASAEIETMIELLGLEDKQNSQSNTLSGGMKRKLSVGMALVGKSKIVILDEPTSGMDVYARRFTWDLLLAEKAERTILLSTHFMEEADVLGERIAIMANGELQCCGSPLFLKRKYGAGYHMTIVRKSDSTDATPITQLIQYHIPNAKLETAAGSQISYSLPNENSSLFEGLFTDLETKKDKLGIDSYGASITTMEEVFLKVGQYAEEGIKAINDNQTNGELNGNLSINMEIKNSERNSGYALIVQQFYALLLKKILFTLRNSTLTISQLILPMFLAINVLVLLKGLPTPRDSPNLLLDLKNFKSTKVLFLVNSNDMSEFANETFISYMNQFYGNNKVIKQSFNTTNLTHSAIEYILKLSNDDIANVNLHMPIGAMVEPNNQTNVIVGLFNNQPFHSPAISLAAVDLAVMRYIITNPDYKLEVSNHPLPRTTADKLFQIQYASPEQFQLAENIMFSMSFLAASFSVLIVKERSIKGKFLQQVCGVKLYLFWITSFIWDFLVYIIPCCLVMLMYYLFDQEPFKSVEQETRLFVVFLVHGFALLPFIYLLSFLFDVPSTAYVRICLYNTIVGIGTFIAVVVTELPLLDLAPTSKMFDWIFSIFFTNFNLGRALYHLYTNYLGNKYCNIPELQEVCNLGTVNATEFMNVLSHKFRDKFGKVIDQIKDIIPANTNITIPIPDVIKPCCKEKCGDRCFPWNANFFGLENPGIGRILILFGIQCIVYWILIVLVEYNVFRSLKYYFYKIKSRYFDKLENTEQLDGIPINEFIDSKTIDEDVKAEYDRIDTNDINNLFQTNALIIKKLTKFYGNFCAVDHISYGVRRGECFGLLGVNGAGKTTTFKMITGDETITSGDIYVNGFNVKSDIQQVQRQIGYCPQFDGLLDQLTGRETLVLFSRLRGIKENEIPRHIEEISKLLYFEMHINNLVKNYSGGTKRKLSSAVALLGDPSVSFLDEPTTGVDPVARRCLWDALTKKLSEGSSIVLTSHSMEECEALCNRLIIMVNGKICCIGSPQQLKNKFGKGYTVLIKVATGIYENRLSRSNSQTGGRRHSKLAWRQNSIVPNDMVLTQNINVVKVFMEKSFPGSELKAIHNNLLHYYISDTSLSWAIIFGLIERAKERLNIEDYSIGQTTLEQIFLSFARKQREDID